MNRTTPQTILVLPLLMLLTAFSSFAADRQILWKIGKPDGSNDEFALAPGGYAQYQSDAFFIVGQSNAKRDWPYVQPGPADRWAGSRPHSFIAVFGANKSSAAGTCKLKFDLLDTQHQLPPKLSITVNGHPFERQLPAGASDDSVNGEPSHGQPCHLEVEFPATLLKPGDNELAITTVTGSWLLYDSVTLEGPAGITPAPLTGSAGLRSIDPQPALVERDGKLFEPVTASVFSVGEPREVSLLVDGVETGRVQLTNGIQTVVALAPEVKQETKTVLTMVAGGKTIASGPITLKPVRHWEVYVLMHSHTDIGYTDLQPNIERKQANNVIHALELIQQTKDFPAGARFKWNLEVMWTADQFYRVATPAQKTEFANAVRAGNIGVDAMYGNLLTGLSRSEEMMRQISLATDLGRRCGATVDSMMISDVPGLTWGIVPALAAHGVKYISDGPNAMDLTTGDRIGYVRVQYENRPFYWLSPSGKERALYWGAQGGYSIGHHYSSITAAFTDLANLLEKQGYPYDTVQMRWTKGDNGPADEAVMPMVRDWNAKYAWPKFTIATTGEAFHAFEKRYGDQLPTLRGDMTPYWEDGAGSSARETALNRHTADRLVQAETIWALRQPGIFPADDFAFAWKNAALYSEHTWGAYNSISQPDLAFVKNQWLYKQGYALKADAKSHELLNKAMGAAESAAAPSVDVYNTASWPRTDLVTLPKATQGDLVKDAAGQPVPSQRLSTGELVFLARQVPPFGASRFTISPGAPAAGGAATVSGTTLTTPLLTVKLDEKTGDIVSLRAKDIDAELADGQINNYLYLTGQQRDLKDAQPGGPAKVTVKESGPLVVSLVAESDAPGCNHLAREVRLVDGLDRVEISDLLDKQAVRSIEGVHLGFSFNIPNPAVHINSPGTIGEPDKDQLVGACKNWYSVERWTDISNEKLGVTWATADAPLMEMGGLTANLPRGQRNPNAYLKTNPPSAKVYSWVMNNHWHTNYRADQDGPTRFGYAIRAHGAYDPVAATHFGVESTEPLLVAPAVGASPVASPLSLAPAAVVATAFKPTDDGQALIVRLFNPTGSPQIAHLHWNRPVRHVWLSSACEEQGQEAPAEIPVPKLGLVTLRVDQ